MFDALGRPDQGRVDDWPRSVFINNLFTFLDKAFHCVTFLTGQFYTQQFSNLFQSLNMSFGFLQVRGER